MRFKNNEEGIALITTLLMLGLLLILALSAVISSTTDIQVSRNVKENTRDIFVADGGLEWFKSQASYYGNNNFTIRNPFANTLNTMSLASGSSSKLLHDGLKWISTADSKWSSPAESACTSSTGRDNSAFPLFYTSVSIGSRTACLKVFAPVWEGIYYPRTDSSSKLYYPRDHIGNYRQNFDSGPVENANPSKPNFFGMRFPDVTSTETISIPQKSVVSDVRFIFGNNLFFFQSKPYADPQTCNTNTADNPDGTCAAYDPNSATVDTTYQAPSSGTNVALNGEPIEGVCTNIDDTKALLIYKLSGGIKYIQGIAQRYDNNPKSTGAGTLDDTPYTFMLGNNGTVDVGVEVDGETAATNCYDRSMANISCSELTGLTESSDATTSMTGFFGVVKIYVEYTGNPSKRTYIYVPVNTAAAAGYSFEPWSSSNGTTASYNTTTATYGSATYSMKLVSVDTYVDDFLSQLEVINQALCNAAITGSPDCSWSGLSGTEVFDDSIYTTSLGTYDFSIYANTVTSVTGSTINIGGVNVTNDDLLYPQ